MEINKRINNNLSSVLAQQDKMERIMNRIAIHEFAISSSVLDELKVATDNYAVRLLQEESMAINAFSDNVETCQAIADSVTQTEPTHNSSLFQSAGEIAMKSAFQTYQFESPLLQSIENWSKSIVVNLATGLNALIKSSVMQEIQSFTSNLGKWLQTVDFSPLISILESIQNIGFDYNYEEVNDIFLRAMFDAKWFPYAGWIANLKTMNAVLDILDTSRASKNRIKRIDRLIFSYYNKEEVNNFKRRWRQTNLPSYMIRILVQSVQAYHRREYALTVSTLVTLWEGIIQEKMNDTTYRISRKTRENLTKLIEENEFDKIFSSFCEEFIFYNCTKPEEVKPDVPGRHGIAHCWYDSYPNRKTALNAILFTDFLLGLEPLEKTEDEDNGQAEDAQC